MSGEQERYIPNAYDYAKAEWMARDLPKPEPFIQDKRNHSSKSRSSRGPRRRYRRYKNV